MIIAIDGVAGSGKSTIARMLADKQGLTYINSGNIYRAITLCLQRKGLLSTDLLEEKEASAFILEKEQEIIQFVCNLHITASGDRVFVNDEGFDAVLRTKLLDYWTPKISALPFVREQVNTVLRAMSHQTDIVVDGRDMTSVVFPHAEYKFYFDASIAVRAKRRHQENSSFSEAEWTNILQARDAYDKNKVCGTLKKTDDSQHIDTNCLTIKEVYDMIAGSIFE